MRILDYTERTAENAQKSSEKHECKCGSKFVSIENFNALQREFESLRNELRNMKEKQIAKDMTFSEVNHVE
jgi:hypothetical protein